MSLGDSKSSIEDMIDNCGEDDNVALAILVLARELDDLRADLGTALTMIANALSPP